MINFLQEDGVTLSCLRFYLISIVEFSIFFNFAILYYLLILSCLLKTELKHVFRWLSFFFFNAVYRLSLFLQCSNLVGFFVLVGRV